MALNRIILWLGYAAILMAAFLALSMFSAVLLLDTRMIAVMGAIAMSVLGIGAIFVLSTARLTSRETNSDALLFLLLFWLLAPIIGALPFWVAVPSTNFIESYFTSVSAMSTTGAMVYVAEDLPRTLILWQSLLQFLGGVSVATFAVVILAALNLTGTGIHRSNLFTLQKGDLFLRLFGIGRVIAGIYLLIAALCFSLMTLGGTPAFDALCLSLSGVSTGGMTPRSEDLFLYVPRFAAFILAVSCALGAVNVSVLWDVLRMRNWRNVRRLLANIEHRTLAGMGFGLTLIGLFYAGLQNLFPIFIEAVFFVSSAGFIYDPISLEQIPIVLLIAVALIGGSALSTAGGLKIIRLILLFRHLGTDISRLSHPSRVLPVVFKDQMIPDRAFLSIWMYFFGYTLVFGGGIIALGIGGLSFSDATTVSAAALSNIGPLLPAALPESGLTWMSMSHAQMCISTALMLIGRVEVLAVFVLITPSFWRQ